MNTIGRYQVVGRLGRGGMATVYKALAPVTGRLTAVKLLRPRDVLLDLVGEEALCRTFLEEARVMGELDHPHLARILDCDFHQGRPFLVLEYYAHSLGSFIGEAYRVETPSRLVSPGKTRDYLCQALLGLERLHFAGIVHRDIKPYNLMITSDDRVKIIDFGLSRVRGEESVRPPGMQVGSPFYAAPEQGRTPEAVDGRADLYSLAVMGLRMLSGRLFDSRKTLEILLDEVQAGCGKSWREWLEKGLRWRREERFADAREMRLVLQALAVPGSPKAVAAEQWSWPAVPRRQARRILYKEIREELDLDPLFRPRRWCRPQLIDRGGGVCLDRHTGLIWQRLGAGFPLDWRQAGEYVRQLNERGEGGREDWRLPTCEELRTVLSPSPACFQTTASPLFDPSVHWLWSCDPSTKKQAWSVDVIEGFFERLDRDGTASVCAVRSSRGD